MTIGNGGGPPGTWGNDPDGFLRALASPWYRLLAELVDVVARGTIEFAHARGLKLLYLPVTSRTVTCPSGLGSDSEPVPVTVEGVETYLQDSMQFSLEYACRLAPQGTFTISPSFRGEQPDTTHLSQFLHSEAEIPGGLEGLIEYVESYVRFVSERILESMASQLHAAIGDVSHIERMVTNPMFERLSFDECVRVIGGDCFLVRNEGDWRTLTRAGERRVLDRVGEFVWVTHFDHMAVPFYQAFSAEDPSKAANADLLFGLGEIVGSGERHASGDEVRHGLALHKVPEHDYSWYIRMKDAMPMRTSGFGMGTERYLMWVLKHDDIRDIPLISRVDEESIWPARVERP
jgi:asparaginyl-tRNA synthetase